MESRLAWFLFGVGSRMVGCHLLAHSLLVGYLEANSLLVGYLVQEVSSLLDGHRASWVQVVRCLAVRLQVGCHLQAMDLAQQTLKHLQTKILGHASAARKARMEL